MFLFSPAGHLEGHKEYYAKEHSSTKSLLDLVNEVKPNILIGASACAGAFTPEILQKMGEYNDRPFIFALSNPTDRAECTSQQAYENTQVY